MVVMLSVVLFVILKWYLPGLYMKAIVFVYLSFRGELV